MSAKALFMHREMDYVCHHLRRTPDHAVARRRPSSLFVCPGGSVSLKGLLAVSNFVTTYRHPALDHQPIQLIELAHHRLSLAPEPRQQVLLRVRYTAQARLPRKMPAAGGGGVRDVNKGAPSSSAAPLCPSAPAPVSPAGPRPPCSPGKHLVSASLHIP